MTGMSLVRSIGLASFVVFVGCSSGSFSIAPGGDTGVATDAAVDDVGGDTAVDPCQAVADRATFCVQVSKVGTHPTYDAASGAAPLGLDGKGVLRVFLYSSDPSATPAPAPATSITYPKSGTIDVDADLPVTIADSLPEGNYWFQVVFEDNATRAKTNPEPILAGDYITVPSVDPDTKKAVYPSKTLVKGGVVTIPVTLQPLRQVSTSMQVTKDVHDQAKLNPFIHGDGPTLFVLYDGLVTDKKFIGVAAGSPDCVWLDPGGTAGSVTVNFPTVVTGSHKILGVLFDYETTFAAADFPGRGSLVTSTGEAGTRAAPTVTISETSWSASAVTDMAFVNRPISDASLTDPYKCGSK